MNLPSSDKVKSVAFIGAGLLVAYVLYRAYKLPGQIADNLGEAWDGVVKGAHDIIDKLPSLPTIDHSPSGFDSAGNPTGGPVVGNPAGDTIGLPDYSQSNTPADIEDDPVGPQAYARPLAEVSAGRFITPALPLAPDAVNQ